MSFIQLGGDINGERGNDQSGYSVSLNEAGNRVAIGAIRNGGNGVESGHVRIYEFNNGIWTKLGGDIDGEAAYDNSGLSVSLNALGNRVAIGAPYNNGNGPTSGHVRIYDYNGTNWVQLGSDINGEAAYDWSGLSVSLNALGNRVAIGAPYNNGNGSDSGHVRIYDYNGTNWVQLGSDINGEATYDQSGCSVSLNALGNRVAIGASLNDVIGLSGSGHVRIYEFNNGQWTKLGGDIDGEANNDNSGWSVSLNALGNIVAIGTPYNDGNGINSGHVRIYQYNNGQWTKLGGDIYGEAVGDTSGYSVSLNALGNIVAIGGNLNDGNVTNSGHVRIYYYNGTEWIKLVSDIDGEVVNDQSGFSVSLNALGTRVAIGARYNGGNGSNSGHVRIYEILTPPPPPTASTSTVPSTPIRVDLNVTVDAEGTISVFTSEEETVSNVIYAQVGIPATSFYNATASKGLIEFWEPSTAKGDKAVAYKDKEEMAKLIASNLQDVLKGQMDAFEINTPNIVASPFSDAKYATNAEQYRKHSDFGRLALAAYAHYLFGHQAATAAITNDEAFMRGILSTDASGAWTKNTTGNVNTWSLGQSPTDANIALNLANLIVTKSESDTVQNVAANSPSLANIVRQVIGQDASRAMDQDNNALLPEMRQLLRFFPGDKIVVNIKLRAPTVTVGTGQKVGQNTLVGLYDKDKVAANVQEENYSVVINLVA
jgi:hypothetical protein